MLSEMENLVNKLIKIAKKESNKEKREKITDLCNQMLDILKTDNSTGKHS